MGGASLVSVGVAMLRMKVAALLLGPVGVGLIGLYQNLIAASAAVGSLGIANAATRQISEATAQSEPSALAETRRALFWAGVLLAVSSGLAVWLFSRPLSIAVTGSPDLAGSIAWLGVAVACTIAGMAQLGLLTGLRRIGDVARVTTFSAVIASVVAVGSLVAFGANGLLLFVLSAPIAAVLVGQWYVMKLPRSPLAPGLRESVARLRSLAGLGFFIMLAGLSSQLSQLVIRALIQRDLGAVDLGYFQAAVVLSVTYIGFILGAMGTDYYPRLTSAISDKSAATRIVNEQTEVALLLAAPLLVMMIGGAPWLLHLLYAEEFTAAAVILRWQVIGDLLKLCSWPLGFVLLAVGQGRTFMFTEFAVAAAAVAAVWIGLPLIGIEASGVAFAVCFGVYLPAVYLFARRSIGFRWSSGAKNSMLVAAAACLLVFGAARLDERLGAAAGAIAAPALFLYALRRLGPMVGGKLIARLRGRFGGA
jgi:PST family polysaccharide transporter